MDEKKSQIIALATLLFILAVLLLSIIFSAPPKAPKALSSLPEEFPGTTSPSQLRGASSTNEAVPLFNALPTDSAIQDTIADSNRKQQVFEKRTAEKAEKAATVMAIARGEKPAPPDPWKKNESPSDNSEVKSTENPDSISREELLEGVKSNRYFVR